MGWLALIQEILALPGQINALIARIDALEAQVQKMNQQVETAQISKTQSDTEAAKTTEDLKHAADEGAQSFRNL